MKAATPQQTHFLSQTEDKECYQEEVLRVVTDRCNQDSEFPQLRAIGAKILEQDTLDCSVIENGKTNYCFKIFLKSNPTTPLLYAKLAFPFARWHDDRRVEYNVERTDVEFERMKSFAQLVGEEDAAPVPTPYFVANVPGGAKLLVTEWCRTDKPLADQFVEGSVDSRVVKGAAEVLALLNLQHVDTNSNHQAACYLRELYNKIKVIFSSRVNVSEDMASEEIRLLMKYGEDTFGWLVDRLERQQTRDHECWLHNDFGPHNILVERSLRSTNNGPQFFGETGDFAIVDWEMSIAGPAGKDAGIFQAWPIVTILAHAVQGHVEVAYELLERTTEFWDTYAFAMAQQGGKDEAYLLNAFRHSLGATAAYLLLMSENMPLDDSVISEQEIVHAKGAAAFIAFTFLNLAVGGAEADLSLAAIRTFFVDLVVSQIEGLMPKDPSSEETQEDLRASTCSFVSHITMRKASRRFSSISFDGGSSSSFFDDSSDLYPVFEEAAAPIERPARRLTAVFNSRPVNWH